MTCMGCMRHAWDGENDNDRPLYIWKKHTEGDHYVIGIILCETARLKVSPQATGISKSHLIRTVSKSHLMRTVSKSHLTVRRRVETAD